MNFHRQFATDEAIRRAKAAAEGKRRPGWPLRVGANAQQSEDRAQ